jgi:hypothetical protein
VDVGQSAPADDAAGEAEEVTVGGPGQRAASTASKARPTAVAAAPLPNSPVLPSAAEDGSANQA